MEHKMENDMETWGKLGLKELYLSCYIGEALLSIKYTHYGNLLSLTATQALCHGLQPADLAQGSQGPGAVDCFRV